MTATFPLIDSVHLFDGEEIAGPVSREFLEDEFASTEGIIQAAHLTNGAVIHFDGEFVGVYRRDAAEAFGQALINREFAEQRLGHASSTSTTSARGKSAVSTADRKAA